MLEAFRLLPRLNVELGTSAREKEEKFYENQSSLLVKYLQLIVTERVLVLSEIGLLSGTGRRNFCPKKWVQKLKLWFSYFSGNLN